MPNLQTKDLSIELASYETSWQHQADKYAYKKFFEEEGLMNDSFAKKFEEVSGKISPY